MLEKNVVSFELTSFIIRNKQQQQQIYINDIIVESIYALVFPFKVFHRAGFNFSMFAFNLIFILHTDVRIVLQLEYSHKSAGSFGDINYERKTKGWEPTQNPKIIVIQLTFKKIVSRFCSAFAIGCYNNGQSSCWKSIEKIVQTHKQTGIMYVTCSKYAFKWNKYW